MNVVTFTRADFDNRSRSREILVRFMGGTD